MKTHDSKRQQDMFKKALSNKDSKVSELMEGDSSRKIFEIIYRSGWLKSKKNSGRIEKILKVHNMQKTLARFEEYRELVKTKASKLPKKHPRFLADGNELQRFYGATIALFAWHRCVKALQSIEVVEEGPDRRKALIVCREIAGRVHRPLENIQDMSGQTGFDSLAGKVGLLFEYRRGLST
ncbi:uncharacterized protein LOC143561268 [Bidens hawaiensis]|uniref:uncharacterized protein LOC143561268 n=1 Tax=Bidens hawaiensis TaxID=980011 RepID=UPI00404B4890